MASNNHTMKYKIIFSLLALSLILVSCKKDLTCDCTTTNSTVGTYYDVQNDGWGYYQVATPINDISNSSTTSDATTYSGTWKRSVAENCPVKSVSTNVNDETYYSDYYLTPNGQPLLMGYKTTTTVTRTCELEKE